MSYSSSFLPWILKKYLLFLLFSSWILLHLPFSRSYVVLSSINLSKTEETTDEIGMPFKQQKTHKTKGFKLIYIKHLNIPQKLKSAWNISQTEEINLKKTLLVKIFVKYSKLFVYEKTIF